MLAYAFKNNILEDLSLKTELNSTLSSSSKSKYPNIPYHTIPCFPLCSHSFLSPPYWWCVTTQICFRLNEANFQILNVILRGNLWVAACSSNVSCSHGYPGYQRFSLTCDVGLSTWEASATRVCHPSVVRLVPTLSLRLPSLVSGIVIVIKFKMAAAAVKFVWLETIRNARKTSLVQDGKKWIVHFYVHIVKEMLCLV